RLRRAGPPLHSLGDGTEAAGAAAHGRDLFCRPVRQHALRPLHAARGDSDGFRSVDRGAMWSSPTCASRDAQVAQFRRLAGTLARPCLGRELRQQMLDGQECQLPQLEMSAPGIRAEGERCRFLYGAGELNGCRLYPELEACAVAMPTIEDLAF